MSGGLEVPVKVDREGNVNIEKTLILNKGLQISNGSDNFLLTKTGLATVAGATVIINYTTYGPLPSWATLNNGTGVITLSSSENELYSVHLELIGQVNGTEDGVVRAIISGQPNTSAYHPYYTTIPGNIFTAHQIMKGNTVSCSYQSTALDNSSLNTISFSAVVRVLRIR